MASAPKNVCAVRTLVERRLRGRVVQTFDAVGRSGRIIALCAANVP